jgi:hypothetical protein
MRGKQGLIALTLLFAVLMSFWLGRATAPSSPPSPSEAIRSTPARKSIVAQRPLTKANRPAVQSSAQTALPAANVPLKQTLHQLEALADAGDAQAASRLYRDTQRCAQTRQVNKTIRKFVNRTLEGKPSSGSAEDLNDYDEMLANSQKALTFAESNAAFCADLSDEEIDSVIPAELRAAQLGDNDAANCYLAEGFSSMPQELLNHPEWLTDFRDNALDVAQTALRNGDWLMVTLLQAAYSDEFGFNPLAKLTGNDPAQAYAYAKLHVLGAARADTAAIYERELAELSKQISAQAAQDASNWAENTFRDSFASSKNPSSQSATNLCGRTFR